MCFEHILSLGWFFTENPWFKFIFIHFCFARSHFTKTYFKGHRKLQQSSCEGHAEELFNWGLVFHQVKVTAIHGGNKAKTWMWFFTLLFDTFSLGSYWESSWAEPSWLQCGFVTSQQFPGQYGNDWRGTSQAVVLGFIKGQIQNVKADSVLLLLPIRSYFGSVCMFACLLISRISQQDQESTAMLAALCDST